MHVFNEELLYQFLIKKKQHILEQFVYLFSLDLPTAVAEGERQKGKREMLCCSQHRDQTAMWCSVSSLSLSQYSVLIMSIKCLGMKKNSDYHVLINSRCAAAWNINKIPKYTGASS